MFLKNLFLSCYCMFFVFNLSSCGGDPTVGPEELFKYPLEVGNKWTYSTEFFSFNFRLNDPTLDTSNLGIRLEGVETAEIIRKDKLLDSIETYVLQTTLVEEGHAGQSENYINNSKDGLYHYAYLNRGATRFAVPKRKLDIQISFNGETFSSVNEIRESVKNGFLKLTKPYSDSLIIEPSPLLSIKYPLTEQVNEWIYRKRGDPIFIAKRYVGKETIVIPSGEYDCYKVQWLYDFNNDNVWDEHIRFFDYISEKGLIKRSILFKDIIFTTPSNPDGSTGSHDLLDEIILTDVNF